MEGYKEHFRNDKRKENDIEIKRLLNESDETDKSVDMSYLFSCLKNQQNYEEKRLNDIRDFLKILLIHP